MTEETMRIIETVAGVVAAFMIGVPMLLFGRRLFWLLGGLAMGLIGLVIAAVLVGVFYGGDVSFNFNQTGGITISLSPEAQRNSTTVAGLLIVITVAGILLGALLLIRFPRTASTAVGFVGGIFLLLQLFELYSVNLGSWLSFPVTTVAGIVVAIIARRNPDTSLIVLSTFIGTILIVDGLKFDPHSSLMAILTLSLMLFGIIFQTKAMHQRLAQAARSVAKLDATT